MISKRRVTKSGVRKSDMNLDIRSLFLQVYSLYIVIFSVVLQFSECRGKALQ